jgi:hypothetical protein
MDAFDRDIAAKGVATGCTRSTRVPTRTNSCINLELWACQTSLDALARKLAGALEQAGLGDAALSVDVKLVEARGPKCRNGAACTPMQHYSTHGSYDPSRARSSSDGGLGTCVNDGDCERGGQACEACYLVGGRSAAASNTDAAGSSSSNRSSVSALRAEPGTRYCCLPHAYVWSARDRGRGEPGICEAGRRRRIALHRRALHAVG